MYFKNRNIRFAIIFEIDLLLRRLRYVPYPLRNKKNATHTLKEAQIAASIGCPRNIYKLWYIFSGKIRSVNPNK